MNTFVKTAMTNQAIRMIFAGDLEASAKAVANMLSELPTIGATANDIADMVDDVAKEVVLEGVA